MVDWQEQLEPIIPFRMRGFISHVIGTTASVTGFPAPLGSICRIHSDGHKSLEAEVIGFRDEATLIQPFEDLTGLKRNDAVELIQSRPTIKVGEELLGRMIDARGRLIDQGPRLTLRHRVPLNAPPIMPLNRPRITDTLETGVRAIDALNTCGLGQRLGIFAGSGVGKSTLLGQLARSSSADVNVVVLVGERGREVREFLERDLGPDGLHRSVLIIATSEESALLRRRCAHVGTAIAEYFRDMGKDVLLMMDSVTRYALAQREIGLAAGEPPTTRGYPPSVFALLPKLLERSGRTEQGSITGLYTVLVEGDDTNEPISDAVRGILDGHLVLSRELAHKGHWPAIDILASISRLMNDLVSSEQLEAAASIRRLIAAYRNSEDLINIGAYQTGSNPQVDQAIQLKGPIDRFLQQQPQEHSRTEQTWKNVLQLAGQIIGQLPSSNPPPAQPARQPDSQSA